MQGFWSGRSWPIQNACNFDGAHGHPFLRDNVAKLFNLAPFVQTRTLTSLHKIGELAISLRQSTTALDDLPKFYCRPIYHQKILI